MFVVFATIQLLLYPLLGLTPFHDSDCYIEAAQQVLNESQFYPSDRMLYGADFLWNIGAINMVAFSLRCFQSIVPLLVLYALLKSVSLLLIYYITRKCFTPTAAMLSALLFMLYPANYGDVTSVLSEVPFAFLVLLAVLLYQYKHPVWAGFALGCADYIRPFALIFIIALLVCNYKHIRRHAQLLIAYFAVILSISSANYVCKGQFIYKAKTGWMALAQYHYDNDRYKDTPNPQLIAYNYNIDYNEKDREWQRSFFAWLRNNKGEYLRQIPIKIARTYVSDNTSFCAFLPDDIKKDGDTMYDKSLSMKTMVQSFPHYCAAQWMALANLLFYYALLVIFALSLPYLKHFKLSWAIVVTGTLFIALVGHGESRFHHAFMPFIIMADAGYIMLWYKKVMQRKCSTLKESV